MITAIIFGALILGGAVYTALNPIMIPNGIIDIIIEFTSSVWALEGILPINAILNCLWLDITIIFFYSLFKIIMGAVNGKPEI